MRLPSAPWAHKSQRFTVVHNSIAIMKLPSFRRFQDRFLTTMGRGQKKALCFARFARLAFVGRWHRTIRIRIRIAPESHDTMPLSGGGVRTFLERKWVLRRFVGGTGCFLEALFPSKTFLKQRKPFSERKCCLTPCGSPPLTFCDVNHEVHIVN